MPISARNKLKGKVARVEKGTVMAEVELEVGGNTIVGAITKQSLEDMDIKPGDEITALIKATSVMFMR